MNRPYHPDWKSGRTLTPLPVRPAWMRQPGEPYYDFIQRRSREFVVWQREQDAAREAHRAEHGETEEMSIDLACGVGTYDGNGNPKGAGW